MDEFFCDYLYRVVNWLYSQDMDDYLAGFDSSDSSYYNFHEVGYPMLGGISMGVALLAAVVFYYVVNHPAFNRPLHWLLAGLCGGVVNLIVGFVLCDNAIGGGDVAQYIPNASVDGATAFMVGLGNLMVAFLMYVVFSLMIKWGSANCKRTPF